MIIKEISNTIYTGKIVDLSHSKRTGDISTNIHSQNFYLHCDNLDPSFGIRQLYRDQIVTFRQGMSDINRTNIATKIKPSNRNTLPETYTFIGFHATDSENYEQFKGLDLFVMGKITGNVKHFFCVEGILRHYTAKEIIDREIPHNTTFSDIRDEFERITDYSEYKVRKNAIFSMEEISKEEYLELFK